MTLLKHDFLFIFVMVLAFLLILAGFVGDVRADGVDDAGFYSSIARHSRPDEIELWGQQGATWMRYLPRYRLPNGAYLLDPNDINYWRDFVKHPCHYPNIGAPEIDCKEPVSSRFIKGDTPLPVNKANMPEPEAVLMLGIGLLALRLKFNLKK